MDAAVGSFLEYLGAERGASPHTLRSYAADLTEFTSFLAAERIDGLAGADTRAIRAFLAQLHRRRLAKATIARKLAAVRSCFRFFARRGVLEVNPARQVRSPRLGRRLPSVLPKDEAAQLLDALAHVDDVGQLHHAAVGDQALGLGPLAAGRRAEQDQVHRPFPPRSFDFLIRPSYWCASRCDWIWLMVSTVTLTTISRLVPPRNSGTPVCAIMYSGSTQTSVR